MQKFLLDHSDKILDTDSHRESFVRHLKHSLKSYNDHFKRCKPLKMDVYGIGSSMVYSFGFGNIKITAAQNEADPTVIDIAPDDFTYSFRLDNDQQVSVMLEYPEDEDMYEGEDPFKITVQMRFPHMQTTWTLGYETQEAARKAFEDPSIFKKMAVNGSKFFTQGHGEEE